MVSVMAMMMSGGGSGGGGPSALSAATCRGLLLVLDRVPADLQCLVSAERAGLGFVSFIFIVHPINAFRTCTRSTHTALRTADRDMRNSKRQRQL